MFTQRDEENHILKFFRNKFGRFLDIGAFDGKCFSTTRALALRGWSGVCIEPSPSVFPALQSRYKDNDKIQTIPIAVADKTGIIDFYDSGGDLVSTLDTEHVKLWEEKGGTKFKKIKVAAMTVFDLFEEVGYDFDFISLDVEGTNIDIFKQFPLDKLKILKMLCIEFDHQENIIIEISKRYGFSLLHKTAENLLLVR